MTPAEISVAKGGDVFVFDYSNTDLADTFVFDQNDWGIYTTDGTTVADTTIHPALDEDNISMAGFWRGSVALGHLTTKSSAHIFWEGSGGTVKYTLNGGTSWTTITEPTAVDLTGTPDLDIQVDFAGGVEDDPAHIDYIKVYVLASDTMISTGPRSVTFSADLINDEQMLVDSSITVSDGEVVGTIEAWVELDSGSTVFPGLPSATIYRNGVAASPTAGERIHVVAVLSSADDIPFSVGPNLKLSHLAYYPNQMSSGQVAALYAANVGAPVRVVETASISVSDPEQPSIYAYTWSNVPTGG